MDRHWDEKEGEQIYTLEATKNKIPNTVNRKPEHQINTISTLEGYSSGNSIVTL